ncbi:hypothetical protein PORY_000664 [Pneumocystis oryctolagi]|uniref:Uncharacterized protein n=1 Tax=Pneumocystis oryctolagi TaxID=42067 RepID=A0ACB7CDC9_9ASCO|nr:hypothetical protein PORY_000664 [Pneumocystis oryctolagi]
MEKKNVSQDEIDIYDRQIRLWGIQAQTRIRNARVLLIRVRELAEEIAKNLVLAGIDTLTLLDDKKIENIESKAHFCIDVSNIGMNYADAVSRVLKRFNPSVILRVNTTPIYDISDDYFSTFDLVIATELELDLIIHLNTICREKKIPFYSCAMYGFYGYIFVDLIKHTYSIEKKTHISSKKKARIEYTEQYCSFSEAINHEYGKTLTEKRKKKVSPFLPGILGLLQFQKQFCRFPTNSSEMSQYLFLVKEINQKLALSDENLKESELIHLAKNANHKWSPIASVIGGVLSQDVLNVLSKQERPIQNWFIFDGENCIGPIYQI